jgi:SAM-dependent methyltransferase
MISVVVPVTPATADAAAIAAKALVGVAAQVFLAGEGAPTVAGASTIVSSDRSAALRAAIDAVKADVTVIQEPDGRWSPERLTELARPILDDAADVVVATRDDRSTAERALAALARKVAQVTVADPLSTRRAFRTQVLRDTDLKSPGPELDAELLVKVAAQLYRFGELPGHASSSRVAKDVWTLSRTLLRYATTDDDADNAHEGYTTLARIESGAPNYNTWLGERFREHAGARVLEVGAGIGTITGLLAEGRERVVALEVDAFYVRRLQNRFRGVPQVVPYLSDVALADFESLAQQRFDSIVLSNVMEHIPDDGGAVRRFAQILPSGGKVLILVPALPAIFGAMDEAVGHYRRYTPTTLRSVLEGNGFEVETLEWMNLVGIPGWFVNGKLLKRRSMPPLQLRLYDQLAPWLARAEAMVKLPVGMSLFCVARRC